MTSLVDQMHVANKQRRRRVVVIGDSMLDRWIHGYIAECQDGCNKFVPHVVVETPGGAANAEACLRHWDANVSLYGYAINDCPIKTRFIEDSKIVFRHDDDGPKTRGAGYKWARDLALEMCQHADAVLLSDYDKGFLPPAYIRQVSELCHQRSVPCMADCKRGPEVYAGCILKCNSDWWARGGNRDADVVTCGGARPVVKNVPCIGDYLPPVECVNHVGAGDCFAAHLTFALACGLPLKEAAAVAHSAGRVYVQHEHNRAPLPYEVAADMALAAHRETISTSTP